METDSAIVATTSALFVKAPPEHSESDYPDARVVGLENRPWFLFRVLPLGAAADVQVDSRCSEFSSSPESEIVLESRAAFRDAWSVPVGEAVSWSACGQATITISGDFILWLFEWDAMISTGNRDVRLETGREIMQDAQPAALMSRDTEAYLFARDATLTFTETAGTGHVVYLSDANAASPSGFLLRQAHGTLDLPGADMELSGETATLHGDLSAALLAHGANQPLLVRLAGGVDAVDVSGNPVFVAPQDGFNAAWTWAIATFALAALALLLWLDQRPLRWYGRVQRSGTTSSTPPRTRRERRGHGYLALAERALLADRNWFSLLYSRRAQKLAQNLPEAEAVEGFALHKRSESRAALPKYHHA
ncbi:MAG TPA: hypothetical protein VI796_06990 [Candidatus Thermoplasmatota archaeon]|nr:hypothetical protein [Candidatus Thermoplasmatota archaeon]